MPYSANPSVLNNRLDLMAPLLGGGTRAWQLSGDRTELRRTADKIREGLFIASLYPHLYPELAQAAELYSIVMVPEAGRLEARLKRNTKVETASPRSELPVAQRSLQNHVQGGEIAGRPVVLVGLERATQVIESWNQHQPLQDPLHFVETTLSLDELTALYRWAIRKTPPLMFLVGDQTLTLSREDPDIAAYAWRPEEPLPEPEVLDI
jgi:hypothetical protein